MRIMAFSHPLIGQLCTSCCLRLERLKRKRVPPPPTHTHCKEHAFFTGRQCLCTTLKWSRKSSIIHEYQENHKYSHGRWVMAASVGDGGVVSMSTEQLSKPRQEKGRKIHHEAKQRDSAVMTSSRGLDRGPLWAEYILYNVSFVSV